MRKFFLLFLLLGALSLSALPAQTRATSIADRTSGRILLDVQNNGEAWYVYPANQYRYFLGTPSDAFSVMRFLGLGITDANLAKIPTNTDSSTGDLALRQRLSGYILLQVQQHGEAWYVSPTNLQRYYLGRPSDAFALMSALGLGISTADLSQISISSDFLTIAGPASQVSSFTLTIARGSFAVDVISLKKSSFKMITDTGNTYNCPDKCTVYSLSDYISQNSAQFGIHGSYFCPPDYASCAGQTNFYFSPVYNSAAGIMINEDRLKFHSGPIMAVDTNGKYYYFHRAPDFGHSVADFEKAYTVKLQAAIANYPSLVENGGVVVESEPLSSNQTTKAVRGGIGYNGERVFMVIAHSASVIDLGYIMQALGAESAMNLDGGGSTALYANGGYVDGPGRQLPNAILFKAK